MSVQAAMKTAALFSRLSILRIEISAYVRCVLWAVSTFAFESEYIREGVLARHLGMCATYALGWEYDCGVR